MHLDSDIQNAHALPVTVPKSLAPCMKHLLSLYTVYANCNRCDEILQLTASTEALLFPCM